MMIFNKKIKNKAVYVVTGLLATLVILGVFLQLYIAQQQRYTGVVINLAGRQRMLSQKILKDILLYDDGKLERGPIEQSIRLFDVTLRALAYGGRVPMGLPRNTFFDIPGVKSPALQKQFATVIRAWVPYKDYCLRFLDNKDRYLLEIIIAHNMHLLDKIDSTVYMMQYINEERNFRLRMLLITEILLITGVLFYLLFRVTTWLRRAEDQIVELESILPICSSCKKIRIDNDHPENMNAWISIEKYLNENNKKELTHGICPDCVKKLYPDFDRDK
jgi:nitrate/nitrite-specific signal transduction histidine kinase